jgi:Glycerol uptake facilitator and related permeases (Major Intrinsic Protein Family)
MATNKAKSASKAKSAAESKKPKTQSATTSATTVKTTNTTKGAHSTFKSFFSKKYQGEENSLEIFTKPSFIGALIGEAIGVFIITIVFLSIQASPLYVMFAIVGASVIAYSVSGAHLNPIVSIGAFVTRRISAIRFICYVIAQLIGAMLAFVILRAFIGGAELAPDAAAYGQQMPELFKVTKLLFEDKEWFLFASELLGSTIIALFFARALQYKKSVFTFAFTVGIGIFTALIVSFTITSYVSGSFALNPAIAVVMEAFSGEAISQNWAISIYAIAPLLGGIAGFLLNDVIATSTKTLEA